VSGKKRAPIKLRELGQLEQAIGGGGIEEEWRRQLQRSWSAGRTSDQASFEGLKELKASQIFDLAAEGDRTAGEVVRYTATILADAVADISILLNPGVVVLGGGVGSHPELCRATQKLTQRNEVALPLLRSSSLGTQAQLYGAVSVSLAAVEQQILD
jgi:glucokinase